MRTLLVQPASNIMKSREEGKPALQPMGLAYVAGSLIANGHPEVEILDVLTEGYYNETPFRDDYIRYGLSPEDIKDRIRKFKPDVVGASSMMSLRKYHAFEICELAKEVDPNIKTVVGGNHMTCFPEEALRTGHVDFVVMGEGEIAFTNLVDHLDGKRKLDFDGIAYRDNGDFVVRKQTEWAKDVDSIPEPAHHLLRLDDHVKIWKDEGYHFYEAEKFTSMLMSRGCPCQCEHCPRDLLFGKKYRARDPAKIVDEIQRVHEELGVEEVQFHEYNGLVERDKIDAFCHEMIDRGLNKIRWGFPIGVWVQKIDRPLLELMKEAGSTYLNLAIESSNQDLLDNIMKGKRVDIQHTQQVIRDARDLGYYMNCFFMLGLEGQDKDDIERTIEFSSRLDVDTISYFIAQPLPGTVFWDHAKEKDLFLPGFNTADLRYGKANTKTPGVTAEELEEYRHKGREDFLTYWKGKGRVPYPGPRGKNFLMMRPADIGRRATDEEALDHTTIKALERDYTENLVPSNGNGKSESSCGSSSPENGGDKGGSCGCGSPEKSDESLDSIVSLPVV